jgi:hypothetical protein
MKNKFLIIITLISVAGLTRLLPHPWNFTPLAGITLMSASFVNTRWKSFLLPLLIWLVTDHLVNIIIYNKSLLDFSYFISSTAVGVYVSMFLIWLIGNWLRSNIKVSTILVASLSSSLIFFLVSNTFVFIGNPFYSQDLNGWLQCLAMGIPFYKNDFGLFFGSFFFNGVMGDLFYTGFLFGSYSIWVNKSLSLNKIRF